MITLTTMITIVIAISIALAFLIYWSKAHWTIKASVLILTLGLGMAQIDFYKRMLGAPLNGYPEGEFLYIYHLVPNDKEILLWSYQVDSHRLYVFPYSRQAAEELEEAKKKTGDGRRQIGEFDEDRRNGADVPLGFSEGNIISGSRERPLKQGTEHSDNP